VGGALPGGFGGTISGGSGGEAVAGSAGEFPGGMGGAATGGVGGDPNGSGGDPTGGSGGVATGGVGGSGGATGGSGGVATGGSGGATGGSGGVATGGSGGATGGSGGVATGGSGGATGGSGGGGAGGSGGSVTVNDPIIPSPSGTCPTFTTGTQTIQSLSTNIVAGTPGATKGPILFTWHGTGSSGTVAINFQLPSSVRNDITAQGGIIIGPNDNGAARTGTSPNGVWYETSDLEYADHIVACAVQNHNIDPRRIYVTGCSAGGLMASAMSVMRSRYVAAVAPTWRRPCRSSARGMSLRWHRTPEDWRPRLA
jgi:hypothetical protein